MLAATAGLARALRTTAALPALSVLLCAASNAQVPVAFPLTTAVGQQSAVLTVQVTMAASGVAASIQAVTQGVAAMDFVAGTGGTCATGTSYTVGQQCTVAVTFGPKFPGLRKGAVIIQRSDNTLLGSSLLAGKATGSLAVLQSGQIDTVAGDGAWIFHGDGVLATNAPIFLPTSIVADDGGNLFLSDSANNRVRRVDAATGLISTVAGNGSPGYSGDGAAAPAAMISNPAGLALDGAGNLYFDDTGNHAVRRVDKYSGLISTVAGTPGVQGYSGDSGLATSARLSLPEGLAFDAAQNLYIADTGNNTIRLVDAVTGLIRTVAGTSSTGYTGDGGPATAAQLSSPWSVTLGSDGALYIADLSNNCVRKVDLSGTISTTAGTGARGFAGDGAAAAAAVFNSPAALVFDPAGNLYIADSGNNRVREVNPLTGVVQTIVGTSSEQFAGDGGPANLASLYGPYALFFDHSGNLLLTDMFHNRVRRMSATAIAFQYATMRVGKVSAPQAQGLQNDGNATLNLTTNVLVNAALDSATTTCSAGSALSSDATCTLGVEFAPTTVGSSIQGSVTINSDAGNSPAIISLSGTVLSVEPTTVAIASSANPSLVGAPITFTAVVTSADTGRTGTVVFLDGTTQICSVALNSSGSATCSTSALPLGQHSMTASYSGDNNNASSVSPALTQVVKEPTTLLLAASPNPAIVTGTVTLTINAGSSGPTPTGTVVFLDGATTLGSMALAGGSATFSTASLSAATHILTVQYAGDTSNASGQSNSVSEVVQLATSSTTLAVSNATVPVGTAITLTATTGSTNGPAPTGSVQFTDGASTLGYGTIAGSTASLTLSTLAPGTHTIVAHYGGDTDNAGSTSAPLTATIQQIGTTTTLASDANPASAGATFHLTAFVAMASGSTADGPITGQVTFAEGGTTLGTAAIDGTGHATIALNNLSVGSHSINVGYAGNTNYAASNASALAEIVQATATTTAISSSNTATLAGMPVTLTLTVASATGIPTGAVTIEDAGTSLGQVLLNAGGTATFSTSALAVGSHSLSAVYAGDANYITSSSASLGQTVSAATTSLALSASAATIVAGGSLTLTAALATNGVTPTGTLTLRDGASVVATQAVAGVTPLAFANLNLSVGTHILTASYGGDSDNLPSASGSVTVVVTLATTTLALSASSPAIVVQAPLSLQATLTTNGLAPTGSITLRDGASVIATQTATAAGSFAFSNLDLAVGTHTLTVAYSGDIDNAPATSLLVTVTVSLASTQTTLTASSTTPLLGQTVTLIATIVSSNPTLSGTVSFQDGAQALGSVPLVNGSASLATTLPAGLQSIIAVYSGDAYHTPSTAAPLSEHVFQSATGSVSSSNNPALAGAPILFTATFTGTLSHVPTGTVTFQDGAATVATATLDIHGIATFQSSALAVGTHTIITSYAGDDSYVPASAHMTETVQSARTEITLTAAANPAAFGEPLTLTAAISSVGKNATGTVTFTDAGIPIGHATLSSLEVATLTLSTLAPGMHSIMANYAGDSSTDPTASQPLALSVQQRTTAALSSNGNPAQTLSPIVLTVAITPIGSAPPTGTVSFADGTTSLGQAALDATGHADVTIPSLAAGTHTLTATYAGDSNDFGSLPATLSQVVQLRPTGTTLTASQTNANNPQQVTLFCVVRWTGPVAPTGTITFTSAGTVLGSGHVDATGVVTLNAYPASTSAGFTATYTGNDAYAGSDAQASLTAISTAVPFTIRLDPAIITMPSKQHITTTLTVASVNGFADTLKFGCIGLPFAATCTFSTLQSTLASNGTTALQLVVDTGDPLSGGPLVSSAFRSNSSNPWLCYLPGFLLVGFALRRSKRGSPLGYLLTLCIIALASGISGCSGLQQSATPPGTYTFKLSVSGQGTGATQNQVIPLTVMP